ncbi:tyrosine-type recombinase/integrase [Aureimonas sp. AU40]|uniref:tyrosine-type recombinase/integrase n=1 Tax=Aureimonas sp. AU40 TaxID=1637747 RepID=UPI00078680F8|nr:tyrosine-type recombinase/integrase [Aureimonas sp. AU40]
MNTAQPPHLWLEPARRDKTGKLTHNAKWVIIDAGKKKSTGCKAQDHAGAARALERYLAEKHADKPLAKSRPAAAVRIADVLRHYLDVRGEKVARPTHLALRVDHLLDFWGDMTLDDVDSKACARYVRSRQPYEGASRRELEDLRAAIGLAKRDNLCREEVLVTLPKKPKPRTDWLERDVAARLIWHAYRKRERQVISRGRRKGEIVETRKRPTRHIARFILFGLYTGTRSRRIWSASFEKRADHPWIDVENGIFYREAPGETASETKRAPSIRIPKRLLAHLVRWKSGGHDPKQATTFLCEYHRGKPGDPKKAFARLVKDVLDGDVKSGIVRHSLRHTAATWLLQDEQDPHRVAGYLGMRTDTLISVYGHHHPDYQDEIGESFSRGRAGRKKKAA